MEDQLAQAELQLYGLLKSQEFPVEATNEVLKEVRSLSEVVIFADFRNVELREGRLWQAHTDTRKYLHSGLKKLRKEGGRPVETRQFVKLFTQFIKQSARYYREYIHKVNKAAGGIAELESIVLVKVKIDTACESPQFAIPPELYDDAKASCHRSLIYLGDLFRYRASEKLDQSPDFGPAIGFYDLASTLRPFSGLGHHQQAVVALEQKSHLRAIYHLYRSMTVRDPHPLAGDNLHMEFGKIKVAWEKGELIQKSSANEPDHAHRALMGWFVWFHSLCYKGEVFRGHEELEREILSQLSIAVKQDRSLEHTLMRMILANISAQYIAGERFQADTSSNHQQSFLYLFRFNLGTFTALLRVFYDDLRDMLLDMEDMDVELAAKLTSTGRRLLPCIRIYNSWLITTVHMVAGLADDDFVGESIRQFWPAYARAVDLVAQAFPIWDLEEIPEVSYMLEEDVDTLEFKPLMEDDRNMGRTRKIWYSKKTGDLKVRFSDPINVCLSSDNEALHRVRVFLEDGLYLANNVETAPIKLRGTRIFHGDEDRIEALVVRAPEYSAPIAPLMSRPTPEKPKVVSYAAAAANGHARRSGPAQPQSRTASKTLDAQLSRMVDDLVDEDDGNHPITPPQHLSSNPAVASNGDVAYALQDSAHDFVRASPQPDYHSKVTSARPNRPDVTLTPPAAKPTWSSTRPVSRHHDRLQSVSKLWEDGPISTFSSGLPTGTLGSPPTAGVRGHSRVNSASSIRSRNSLNAVDPWAPADSAPRTIADNLGTSTLYGSFSSLDQTGMASPLLFGAGGGPWSTGPRNGLRNMSPPNGQGG